MLFVVVFPGGGNSVWKSKFSLKEGSELFAFIPVETNLKIWLLRLQKSKKKKT